MIYKAAFDGMPWEKPMAGVRHKVLPQGGRQLRLVEYSKDLGPHWCEKGHIGYMISGRMAVTIGSEKIVYGPGDGVFIPSGPAHRHLAQVLTETAVAVFVEDV